MTIDLESLKFGELNDIKRNNLNPAGDRRRTTTATAIRFATEKAFEVNTLENVTKFTGFVVGSRRIDRAIAEYKGSIMSQVNTPVTADPDAEDSDAAIEVANYLYKVYIPELEPLPAPESYNDPVIGLYADVSIAKGLLVPEGDISLNGALVEVTYQDAETLSGPKITRIIPSAGFTLAEAASTPWTGTPVPLGSGGRAGNFTTPAGKIKTLTWDDRKILYAALKPLFDYISSGEGNINSLNRGVAGDTPSEYSSTVFTDGKPLSQRTIGDVQKLYKGRSMANKVKLYKKDNTAGSVWRKYKGLKKNPETGKVETYTDKVMARVNTPGLTAAGKFQWVKGTMKSCIQKVGLTQNQLDTLIFNNDNQNIMGTYLILDKAGRSRLGGYLLGLHDNVADAGQELAMEFASVPNQFNAKNGLKKNWICPRGYNHYCSDPKPGAKEGANAKYRPTSKKPDGVAQKLREARDAMAKNPEAVAVARKQDPSAFA